MTVAASFRDIRVWRGSKDQAFEELCYQLRDPTPTGAELTKTGSPDAGLEWYFQFRNGVEWGWQAKYSFDIDVLLLSSATVGRSSDGVHVGGATGVGRGTGHRRRPCGRVRGLASLHRADANGNHWRPLAVSGASSASAAK